MITERQQQIQQEFTKAYLNDWDFFSACDMAEVEPKAKTAETYYVYCLVRMDTSQVIYVGKGKGNRMHQHMKDVQQGRVSGAKKYRGLVKLREQGIAVKPYAIIDSLPEADAYRIESAIIDELSVYLLNSQHLWVSSNQKLLAECEALLQKVRPQDKDNPVTRCAKQWAESVLLNYMDEVEVAEATGYKHGDWWDSRRIKARQDYISSQPKPEPRKAFRPPLEWARVVG